MDFCLSLSILINCISVAKAHGHLDHRFIHKSIYHLFFMQNQNIQIQLHNAHLSIKLICKPISSMWFLVIENIGSSEINNFDKKIKPFCATTHAVRMRIKWKENSTKQNRHRARRIGWHHTKILSALESIYYTIRYCLLLTYNRTRSRS